MRANKGRSKLRKFGVTAALLMAVGMAGVAEAAVINPYNDAGITIPAGAPGTTSGPSDPYPSELTVNWCAGTIQDVDVGLFGLTHGATIDLDILLVGPGGQSAVIASDSGDGTGVTDLFLEFDDEAASPPPTPWVDGTYQPVNVGAGDVLPGPAPAPPYGTALSVFDGANPNGTWRLFINDDLAMDSGALADGWDLTIQTTSTAPSSTGMCIAHSGTSEPYPTTVTTSGLAAPIQDVNVTLNGLTHSFPDDLDVLLAGAGGRNTLLMSDAAGSGDFSGNLTFDDDAANALPDEGTPPLIPGSYKPTNFESLENVPTPAPATQGTSLGTFDGLDPNGTWSLFIRDDLGGDFGVLNSWSLQITTPSYTISPAKAKEGKKATFDVTRTGDIGQGVTATFATAPGSAKQKDFKALAGTLSFAPGDSTEQVVVKAKNDNKDEKKNERFSLNLTAGTVTFTGTGKIKDTDK